MSAILKKFNRRADAIDSLVCVGLDPELEKLPARFLALPHPLFEFNKWIIDQTAPFTAAYKPNMGFYEARGLTGLRELELTMHFLRDHHPGIVTICDAKRGDNANTNLGYVTAIFDRLGADAVTLHPYMGREALAPFLARADKACIILCRTSNAGGAEFQDLEVAGRPLWQALAERVATVWNEAGNCMLVVGATYPEEMARIRAVAPNLTLLVPGVGTQGGDVSAVVAAGIDPAGKGLIISSSRAILYAEDPAAAARSLRDEINAARKAIHASH